MARQLEILGRVLDEKYRIDKLLGQGGMGAVFLATHVGTERPVALKVIMPEFMAHAEFVERFKREAKAAGRLRHANVVNVTDFGFANVDNQQVAYLVMEYLDGGSLGDLLKKRGALPLGLIVDIVEQVSIAIDEAHRQGIVHRDLKPDNIWLQPDGRGGIIIKVLDFGLAKLRPVEQSNQTTALPAIQLSSNSKATAQVNKATAPVNKATAKVDLEAVTKVGAAKIELDAVTPIKPAVDTTAANANNGMEITSSKPPAMETTDPRLPEITSFDDDDDDKQTVELTRVGTVMGTPIYMSPEQCLGQVLDKRSDIYSLGVVVYQMLTGKPPFLGKFKELVAQHTFAAPPPLTTLHNGKKMPPAIARIVISAMAKTPDERPPSAGAFAAALRANSEGGLPILREAFDIYRRQFSVMLRLSLVLYTPFLIGNFLLLSFSISRANAKLPPLAANFLHSSYWIISFLLLLFANSINAAAFVPLVAQLSKSRTATIEFKRAVMAIFRHALPLTTISLQSFFITLFRSIKLIVPGVNAFIDYSLAAAVVMMEDKRGLAALARSKELVDRLRAPMQAIQLRAFCFSLLTMLAAPILFAMTGVLISLLGESRVEILIPHAGAFPSYLFVPLIFSIPYLALAAIYPFIAIAIAVYYLRVCWIGGERAEEGLRENFQTSVARVLPVSDNRAKVMIAVLLIASFGWMMFKNTLLTIAAGSGLTNTVEALLLVGAKANSRIKPELLTNFETTPLVQSVVTGNENIVALLLEKGADANITNEFKWTPLMEAVNQQRLDLMRMLVARGANVNAVNNPGWSVLMTAVKTGDLRLVNYLLEHNAYVNAVNNDGETALIIAVNDGYAYMIKPLLARGINVNIKDVNDRAALSYAAEGGDSFIVKELLLHGADKNAKDGQGRTALDYAKDNNNEDVIKLLTEQ